MELTDVHKFCGERARAYIQSFKSSLNLTEAEIRDSSYQLIQALKCDAEDHISQGRLDQAEKCYSLALHTLQIVAEQKSKLTVLLSRDLAIILSNRSFVRCKQGKFIDALKDAENCIATDSSYAKGYWRASQAYKALSEYAEAAHFLFLTLSQNVPTDDDFVCFISELAILVSQIKNKEQLKKYRHVNISTTSSLHIWSQIVRNLVKHNEFEGLAILTTGLCDSCHVLSTVVHKLANVPGLSFDFLNVGKMLKFLADKEGTKAWHLKLAEFAVKRGANILTVSESFLQPFLVAMTALSIKGEVPSFLLLAWDKMSPMDYDQKDSQGNSPTHILAKHVKYSKQTSEIICRDLLAHGCLTTEVDEAGKLPHQYIPSEHTVHKQLKYAMKTPGNGLLKRLELIRKKGNQALADKEYDRAIEFYQKALLITSKFSVLNTEAAILYSNMSAVYLNKEVYLEALKFAENGLKADPKFCKGYFRKGQALSKMGKHSSACYAFISGYREACEESLKINFSMEAAKNLHYIPEADSNFVKEMKYVLSSTWPKIIENLTQNCMWVQVNSLVLGPPYEDIGLNARQGKSGLMANFDASKAVLSTIFEAVGKDAIDAPALITLLLRQGASPASLVSSKKETYYHAAVRFCLLTNDTQVLKLMLGTDIEKKIQTSRDFEDHTPLHTLCIESERRNIDGELPIQIAILLTENEVDIDLKDKYRKKAADYAVLSSQLKEFIELRGQKAAGAENFQKWQEVKEKGNKAFKNADYKEAQKLYSQAIMFMEMRHPYYGVLSKEDGRNLAVLYGNRAECWYKQGNMQMFLDDAKKSVDADGSWYKGHWRVGRAFKEQGKGKKAVKAFLNTFKALKSSDGEELAISILSDLVETVYEQRDGREASVEKLNEVCSKLWPQITYDFIVKLKWKLAEFFFRNCAIPPVKCYNFDLSPFCNKDQLDNQRWVCGLLLWYLISGVDHTTLKFHTGDTYFHAVISIIVLSGSYPYLRNKLVDSEATQLLTFVMAEKVIPNNEINIQDNKGNTLLHHLATLKGSDKMREFLACYLLNYGVDIMTKNFEGKQVLELVSSSDVIRNTLQEYLIKNKLIDKMKDQTKHGSSRGQNNQPEKGLDYLTRTEQSCEICERRLGRASEWQKKENYQEVYSNLVEVVNCNKSIALHHKKLKDLAVQRLAALLSYDVAQEIPSSLFKISEEGCREVLALLANSGKWRQLKMFFTKFEQVKAHFPLADIAKHISLTGLVKDQSLIGVETTRIDLISLLVRNGAMVDSTSSASALTAAMKHAEWQVALKLLEIGVDPRGMTLTPDDTPYHAALQVALNQQPGNFSLLEKLKNLHDNDEAAYPYLNVSCQDKNGNTLLHIATQAKFTQHSLHAVKLLCEWNVEVKIPNKKGNFAMQYLLNEKDRRAEYLRSASVGGKAPTVFKDTVNRSLQTSVSKGKQQKSEVDQQQSGTSLQRPGRPCDLCEEKLERALKSHESKNYRDAFSDLIKVINSDHKSDPRHTALSEKALKYIIVLLSDITVEVPPSVFKLSAKKLKEVLSSLASSRSWTQLGKLITEYRLTKGQSALPDFAKNISLIDLVKDQSLKSQEGMRLNLINLLMSHGATMDANASVSAIEVAMRYSEWQVALKLLEIGADPRGMTLSAGDTPYHAALQVALNKEPGNFLLMEKLKLLQDSEMIATPYLNVSCQDGDGNTLLHIAAQAKFSQHSLHAVELLCQWNVIGNIKNKEGKLAIQYLSSDKDRRAQYLKRYAGGSAETAISKNSGEKVPESSRTILSGEAGGVRPKMLHQSGIGTSGTSLEMQRADMEIILSALPDVTYNFLTQYDDKSPQENDQEMESDSDGDDANDQNESENEITTESNLEVVSDPVTVIAGDHETELSTDELDIDVKAFDTLEWDIECTEEVWSTLRARKERLKSKRREDGVQKSQRKKNMSRCLKQMIVKKIQLLASGDWRPHLQQRVEGTPDSLQLFKIAFPQGVYVLWELAIAFSPRMSAESALPEELEKSTRSSSVRGSRVYSELIRVWSIVLKHSQLQHIVHKIICSHERGKFCIIQKNLRVLNSNCQTSSSKRLPVLYVEQDLDTKSDGEMHQGLQRYLFPPASAHENEFHVLKFYSFSSSLVSAVLDNTDTNVDFPFKVTDIEHAVISLNSKSPLLLLGRSGTGKTTCCLYRMWSVFLHYWEQANNCGARLLPRENYPLELNENDEYQEDKGSEITTKFTVETSSVELDTRSDSNCEGSDEENAEDNGMQYNHLHQLFVTKNPVLCSEVQKNFTKLCAGTDVVKRQNINQNTALPNTLQDVDELSFPLFLTSRQLLLMLDASVDGESFFPRDEDLALKVTIPGWGTQEDIFNIIPLEHDDLFDSDNDADGDKSQARRANRVHNLGAKPGLKVYARQECTYEVFAYEVWPKVAKKTEIDCHPSLVWTEIISFIKGSNESLHTEKGYLDKTQYINLGRKRAPNFTGNRSQVYDIFLEYHHYKQQHSLFDEADLVYKLYCRLHTMTFQPWILHEIYVDETQDFTQAELALLVSLCSEPNKMFLTGDTAQSIMRGISFRFNDLRSLFFNVKESAKKSERPMSTIKVPQKVHQLTHNYRSHTGILSLASSVLDILTELFPDSFDALEKDQGMFAGPKPIIIESSSAGDLALLLTGSKRKTSHIEFGAHQAVLVVNETAKTQIPEELAAGIVLTIFESKGLEFDDVLIYNFFKDSHAKKEWRVVTEFLRKLVNTEVTRDNLDSLVEIDADVLAQASRTRPLQFDPNQHKVLNSELKHLYTAITRARVNVWIFDEDDEKRAPMFEYFKTRSLVKCMGTQECENVNEAIMFADKSSSKEWRLAGDKYMRQKLYTVAAKCYRLAEQPNKERVALAYQIALEASRMRSTPKAMRDKYFKAGTQFVECGDLHRAAMCFQNSQDFLLSALAYEKNGQFEQASVQYKRSQKANDASRCLEQIGHFGHAVRVLVDHDIFDRAIDCLHRYEMEVEQSKRDGRAIPAVLIENKPSDVHSEASLCYRSAIFHYERGEMSKAIAAIKRSKNIDDQVLFLQDKGFWEEAAVILRKDGKTEQAAQLMLRSGNTEKALEWSQEGFHKSLTAFIHLVLARRCENVDYNVEKIKQNASKALIIYTELQDYNGQAQAKLMLGKQTTNEKLIGAALQDFRKVKPPNQAGELECFSVHATVKQDLNTLKDCQEFLKNINLGFSILDVILNPSTENSDKQQLYMSFYGLELDTVGQQVLWYPHQYPLCKVFMESTPAEKKFISLGKAAAVSALEKYFKLKIETWAQMVQNWLEEQKISRLPCIKHQMGQPCSTDCRYMHRFYESKQEELEALNLLIFSVHLDYSMQTGLENLEKYRPRKPDMKFANKEEFKWKSVEEVLHFVLPTYTSALRVQLEHVQEIVKRLRSPKFISAQFKRYFLYLWNNPGRVGKKLSHNILKERCKSADWIVQACFFAQLLKLELDVEMEVSKLQNDLMENVKRIDRWIRKSWKYAVFTTPSEKDGSLLIEAIGARFVQSFYKLTKSPQDSYESLFPFTKMISALGSRGNLSLMPKLDHFVFCIEFYLALTWLFIAKANHAGNNKACFYMSNSYLINLHLVSVCIESNDEQPLTVENLVMQYMCKWNTNRHLMERQNFIANFLVGHNQYSNFSLISQVNMLCEMEPPCFLLAERIIILSALFLLNIPAQYSNCQYEIPIRRELFKLRVTESLPARLATLIIDMKKASNYHDVSSAVLNYFHQQGCDRLILCQWLDKKNHAMQFFDARQSETLSFNFYDANIQGIAEQSIKTSEEQLSQDKDVYLQSSGMAEELDAEDIERQETKKAETAEEHKKWNAVKTIVRFLKVIVLKSRLHRKVYSTYELDELFKPFAVKDNFCGICAVNLEQLETSDSTDSKRQVQQTKDTHCQGRNHMDNLKNFETFRNLYISQIHDPYQKIIRFVHVHKVADISPIYKNTKLDTSKVLNALKMFDSALKELLHMRQWLNTEALFASFKSLAECFETNHIKIQTEYKESMKETSPSQNQRITHGEYKEEGPIEVDPTDETNSVVFGRKHNQVKQYGNRHHRSNKNRQNYGGSNRQRFERDKPPRFQKQHNV